MARGKLFGKTLFRLNLFIGLFSFKLHVPFECHFIYIFFRKPQLLSDKKRTSLSVTLHMLRYKYMIPRASQRMHTQRSAAFSVWPYLSVLKYLGNREKLTSVYVYILNMYKFILSDVCRS